MGLNYKRDVQMYTLSASRRRSDDATLAVTFKGSLTAFEARKSAYATAVMDSARKLQLRTAGGLVLATMPFPPATWSTVS